MSSPLSSLKKGNRGLSLPGHIAGHRPIPFRHPEYSEDESRLLEEITTSMVASRIKARDPFNTDLAMTDSSPNPSLVMGSSSSDDTCGSDSVLPPPSDRELMKLMMARLAIMEQKVQKQEQEIQTKDRRIKVLEDKLRIVSQARGDNNNSNDDEKGENAGRVKELEQHCLLLQQQVHEMETFLADYGMVWVGEQDDPESDIYLDDQDSDEVRKAKQMEAGLELDDSEDLRTVKHNIDFDLLMDNIRDLNIIAGEGEAHIQHTADGARLKRQEPIPITFYANGMMMFEGPFRPYTEPTTVECVQDFLDGYFPSELQSRYPEGVPFIVRDMREVFFKPKRAIDVFSGVGNLLGGEIQPSRLIPSQLGEVNRTGHAKSSAEAGSSTVSSQPPFPPIKVDAFLNKLPKSVIRQGKVVDIRDSVGKTLTGETSGSSADRVHVSVVETDVTKTIQKALSESKTERPKTARDVSTLRIKSENGSHTYIVKMRFNETIGDLRRYLNAHRAGESTQYEICSTYPRKVFEDDKASMDASGLVPNGVLHLQTKKKT